MKQCHPSTFAEEDYISFQEFRSKNWSIGGSVAKRIDISVLPATSRTWINEEDYRSIILTRM